MKKIILTITVCITSLSVCAYDFCVDDIFYNILPSGDAVEVTHDIDYQHSSYGSYTGKVTIPATVTHEGSTYNVTAIGDNAFAESIRLSGITLPESILTIGRKAFYSCERIDEITIPQSVTTIGELAFYQCVKLENLNIPASLSAIGNKAFLLCNALTQLTVDDGNAHYCSSNNIIYNKDKTLLVAAMPTFSGHLDIPATVTEIGNNAFVECDGLTSINLNNIVTIHDYAFFDCKGLTSITLPESVEKVGLGAFFNCTNLTTVVMSNNLREICDYAFMRCNSLKEATFAGQDLVIGNHAFEDCKVLTISDPNECIVSIGEYAFASCIKHRTLVLPNSIKHIGNKAFFACAQINRLTLGNKLETLGEYAFLGCKRVRDITVNAITPPSLYKNTFNDNIYNNSTLAVPDESLEAYKAAQYWQDFLSIEPSAVTAVENNNIKVVAADNRITVTGTAYNSVVEVYSTDGKLVQHTTTDNLSQHPLADGVYIIKVANTTHKVAL